MNPLFSIRIRLKFIMKFNHPMRKCLRYCNRIVLDDNVLFQKSGVYHQKDKSKQVNQKYYTINNIRLSATQ